MSDAFERLAGSVEARRPRAGFTHELRTRLLDALGLDADTPMSPSGRTTAMSTSINPAVESLMPYLTVHDASAAIDFYVAALGAAEDFRVVGDDGRLGHAELTIGSQRFMLSDEYPDYGAISPRTLGGTAVTLHLSVSDCDATHDAAVANGATSDRAPGDQTHGSRTATITDPFGHRWMLSQTIEEIDLATYAEREGGGFTVEPGS